MADRGPLMIFLLLRKRQKQWVLGRSNQVGRETQKPKLAKGWSKWLNTWRRENRIKNEVRHYIWPVKGHEFQEGTSNKAGYWNGLEE